MIYKIDKTEIEKFGFLNAPIDKDLNLVEEINKLRSEKNAIIMAHFYQNAEIQDIADFVGDSLALAQKAEKNDADIIVLAGVHFMAETAKILCPEKKVLIPDVKAGCSLAESAPADAFEEFVKAHPGHTVISYVNTTAEIKALTDIVCTSTNAVSIVESLPKDEKIIFAPDRNLGNYINAVTGRDMVVWDGACHVHEEFSLERILELKNENPEAKIISHPECQKPIIIVSDYVGSTSALLNYVQKDSGKDFIVATESGILHQMRKACPDKNFIAAPPKDSTCACNDCNFMKLITMEKIYNALKYEMPEVTMEKELIDKSKTSIVRMLDISKSLGL